MINTNRLLKVGAVWISIVYVICYAGVAFIPGIREWFMLNALHTNVDAGIDVLTVGTFISGLIIWNVVAAVALWIFAGLWNKIGK